MLALTDNPLRALAAVGPSPAWTSCPVDDLSPGDQVLWRALGDGDSVWTAEIPCGLPSRFWHRLVAVDEARSSQFDQLRELFRDGWRSGGPVACVALTGRDFHGHRQRTWVAERGNLHLSVGLEPRRPAVQLLPALTMLPAVAAVEAIQGETGGAACPGIKWVNDVLLGDRKVAGVLTSTQSRQGSVDSAVLGIGLNVARAPAVPPTVFVPEVTCLAGQEGAGAATLAGVLREVLVRLACLYEPLVQDGPRELFERYRAASIVLGRQVRVYDETFGEPPLDQAWPEPLARGTVVGVGTDLSLRLQGRAEPVTRGRLAFERVCQRFGI